MAKEFENPRGERFLSVLLCSRFAGRLSPCTPTTVARAGRMRQGRRALDAAAQRRKETQPEQRVLVCQRYTEYIQKV